MIGVLEVSANQIKTGSEASSPEVPVLFKAMVELISPEADWIGKG